MFFNSKDNDIRNEGIESIAEMLKVNNSLQKLNITCFFFFSLLLNICTVNDFNDISKLGEALKYNRSLTELMIEDSKLFYFHYF